jgi:hypothetical protein
MEEYTLANPEFIETIQSKSKQIFGNLLDIQGVQCSILVEALCYKQEGRGFETRQGELMFSIYLILAALGHRFYSAFNRNEYQKLKNNASAE